MTHSTEVIAPQKTRFASLRGSWFIVIAAAIVFGVAGFTLGILSTSRDLNTMTLQTQDLQAQNQKLKRDILGLSAARTALDVKLASVSGELEKIRPAKDTYNLLPNQSIIVADGLLTIALVGPPATNRITLNINGSQRDATSGDRIEITAASNAKCTVVVQSFDMFQAVLNAACAK